MLRYLVFSDLDEKYNKRRDRFGSGISMEFKDLSHYKPDIKIDYIDESGRNLNQKEAFRALSHRFHGKGSGKRKQEKRSKKLEQENVSKVKDYNSHNFSPSCNACPSGWTTLQTGTTVYWHCRQSKY